MRALVVGVVLLVGGGAPGNDSLVQPGGSARVATSVVAPGAVTDLRAFALSDSAVVLTWTEVASASTAVPRYAVRYDSLGAFAWATAPDVLVGGCAAPIVSTRAAGGRPRACVLAGLAPNVAYLVQMVAYTGALNSTAVFGPLSNVAPVTTASRSGPLLVWRPRMFVDSVFVAAASLADWGATRFPLQGRFLLGDREAVFYDSTGTVVARGFLVVVKP